LYNYGRSLAVPATISGLTPTARHQLIAEEQSRDLPVFLVAMCVAATALSSVVAQGAAKPADSKKPPNVLLICVDDLRNCLNLDGDRIAQTPQLDRLAAEGRYFRHHYVQVAG
jgi:hypothetical protein